MAIGCVYLAVNTINGKAYIGKTISGLSARRQTHIAGARLGRKQPFPSAIRKYGPNAFVWRELYLSDDRQALLTAEIAMISAYKAAGSILYNLTAGGDGRPEMTFPKEVTSTWNKSWSEESKMRARAAWTPERRAAQAERMRNRPISEETRRKSSLAKKGNDFAKYRVNRATGNARGPNGRYLPKTPL